jgi:Zn-dependent metalloprotease
MTRFSVPARIAVSIAIALAAVPALAQSANSASTAAVARARAHIASFPAATLSGPNQTFTVRDVILDADGSEHVRFDRQYRGLPVIGGDFVVHTAPNGTFRNASRTMVRGLSLTVRPAVRSSDATRAALAAHPGDPRGVAPALLVYARGDLPVLAYDVRVFGEQADGTPMEKHVIVDANRGEVLDAWDDIHTGRGSKGGGGSTGGGGSSGGGGTTPTPGPGTGHGYYYDDVTLATTARTSDYELSDPNLRTHTYTYNNGRRKYYLVTDADNDWGTAGSNANPQSVAVDAHYGTDQTLKYYYQRLGRDGIDGAGNAGFSGVHYSSGYNNAFWSDSCFCMTYGDGDGRVFNPLVSLDVAGHEMTHGVTSRTAGLIYSGESGGLNEATSDIMGTMVEQFADHPSDAPDYLVGEKIVASGFSRPFLRSMVQPSNDGSSADCWYSGLGNLDVHYSSGVANHFFYLLAEGSNGSGGPSKTCQSGDSRTASGSATLTGIGADAAAKIWYRALTVYMTSRTNYAGARVATQKAATDLFPDDSTMLEAVNAAWDAVNVK